MHAPYTWHPGIRGINSVWARPTHLLADEIFSSWLVRSALAQGCDPLVLTGTLWPRWRIWTQDVDRAINEQHLRKLCTLAGIPTESFLSATLHLASNRICGATPPRMQTCPWILSLGTKNIRRLGGLQYCPDCLASDPEPYYRIQWRLAWHTGCEIHDCLLLDRCWNCTAPLEPHRLHAIDKCITICPTCKQDLRTGSTRRGWSKEAQRFQCTADRASIGKKETSLGRTLESSEWFALASYMESLVRRALNPTSENLRAAIESMTSSSLNEISLLYQDNVEKLRTTERERLFRTVWRIMASDFSDFEDVCISYKLSRQSILQVRRKVPQIISELLQVTKDSPRQQHEKAKSDGTPLPRSRRVVQRMMEQLEHLARQTTA